MAEGRAGRLLHHVAELARQNDVLVSAWKQGRFDEQDVAAGFGPGQAGRHPGPGRPERHLFLEPGRAEVVVHLGRVDDRLSAGGASAGRVARRAATLRAIVPSCRSRLRTPASRVYSAMTSPQRRVGDLHRLRRQAVLAHLPRQQVLAGDVQLLLLAVAGQLDDLHAVEQRRMDGARAGWPWR